MILAYLLSQNVQKFYCILQIRLLCMIISSEILKTGLWHSRGQRFDPAYLHQVKRLETKVSSLFVLPLWCAALNRFAQINHVPELNVVFVYGVVVVGYEKVPHNVGTGEAAFFIEGDSERAVAGTDL